MKSGTLIVQIFKVNFLNPKKVRKYLEIHQVLRKRARIHIKINRAHNHTELTIMWLIKIVKVIQMKLNMTLTKKTIDNCDSIICLLIFNYYFY